MMEGHANHETRYIPDVLPHAFEDERIFVNSIMSCASSIHVAKCLRGELLAHLHPHAMTADIYIHAPLIGREELSNEGMMLTNVSLLELMGLLSKRTDGSDLFHLGPNALNRHIFLYGDALSVNLHSSLYDKILRQITRLGNKDYVDTLLQAQRRLFVQKGQFHQLMHHSFHW